MMKNGMDGLIVACKQHPTAILLSLLRYLAPSRPFAVFSPYKEPLLDAYTAVKETGRSAMVTLSETWLRNHQVGDGRRRVMTLGEMERLESFYQRCA